MYMYVLLDADSTWLAEMKISLRRISSPKSKKERKRRIQKEGEEKAWAWLVAARWGASCTLPVVLR
jgi:hypothetical protein